MIILRKIYIEYFLILLFFTSSAVVAQDGSDSLNIGSMNKKEILKLSAQDLFSLPIEDLMSAVEKTGVGSIDELISLVSYTTSRNSSSIDEAPGIVTVISRDQINDGAYRSIAEVLQTISGIYIIQRQEGRFSICIRGIKDIDEQRDYRTLTLVDGNPIYGIDESFPLEYIESIEIVRGPGSSLYGANAYAGIISINTLDVDIDKQPSQVSVLGATDRLSDIEKARTSNRYHFLMSTYKNDLSFMISSTHYVSEGYVPELNYHNAMATNNEDNKKYTDIFLKGKYKNLSFNTSFNTMDKNAYARSKEGTYNNDEIETKYATLSYDDIYRFGEIRTSIYAEQYTEKTSFDQFVNKTNEYKQRKAGETNFLKLNADFQYNSVPILKINHLTTGLVFNQHRHNVDEEFRFWANKNASQIPIDTLFDRNGKEVVLYETEFDEKQQIRWLGTSENDTISMPFIINSFSFYLQDRLQINEKTAITIGLRHDWQEQYGHSLAYRAAFNRLFTSGLYFKTQYGTAFRAPFVRETNVILENFEHSGNPNLKVEKVKTAEVLLGWSPNSKLRIEADGYYNILENYIVPNDPYANNSDKIVTSGIEFDVNAILSQGFSIRTNFSYIKAINKKEFPEGLSSLDLQKLENVSLIPKCHGSLVATWKSKTIKTISGNRNRLRVNINSNFVGERKRPYEYNEKKQEVVDIYHAKVKKSEAFGNNNLKQYTIFNANINSYIGNGFSVNILISNLANKKYYSPPFLPDYYDTQREGRNFQFTIKYEW